MSVHADIQQTLAELEMVSAGTTTRYNPTGSGGDPPPRPPGGFAAHVPYLNRYRALLAGAPRRVEGGRDSLQRLLEDARAELQSLTGRTGRPPAPRSPVALDTTDGVRDAALEDAPGRPADHVAQRLGITVWQARRWYAEWGLDPASGEPVAGEAPASEAVRLAGQGCSERQIAALLRITRRQVRHLLGRRN